MSHRSPRAALWALSLSTQLWSLWASTQPVSNHHLCLRKHKLRLKLRLNLPHHKVKLTWAWIHWLSTPTSPHPRLTCTSSVPSFAKIGRCMVNANTETSVHSPIARIIWWSKLKCLFSTRPSFARSLAQTDIAHMECDASLSMIWVKPTLALSNKLWQLVYQNQPPNRSKNLKWASTLPFSIFQPPLNLRNLSLKRFRLSSNLKLQLPPLPVQVASATSKHLTLSPRKRLSTETFLCIVSTLVFKSTRKRTKCSRRRWPRRSTWRAFSNQKSTTWTSILLKFLAWRSSKTCRTTTPHKMCRTRPTSREATSTETPQPMSFS